MVTLFSTNDPKGYRLENSLIKNKIKYDKVEYLSEVMEAAMIAGMHSAPFVCEDTKYYNFDEAMEKYK